jgi:ribosomal protein S12 methylthiotransferase
MAQTLSVRDSPASRMETVHLLTLGCPKNLVDSELILGSLADAGYEVTSDPTRAEVLIVNTCAFIEAAKKESISAILEAAELKTNAPGRRLVVAGCMAQRYGAQLAEELPEIDILVGTGNFLELPELLRRSESPGLHPRQGWGGDAAPYLGGAHLLPRSDAPRIVTGNFFTSYLKVSEGCNHKCAFCIIPRIRGRHESRPPADLVAEARRLAEGGVREINLIAQDLTAYGRDLAPPSSLARLLAELNRIEQLSWIRLLYCYPNFVTDTLLDAVAELPKVVKYLDMPLQHADDMVLRAMRRERSGDALRRLLDRIRSRVAQVSLRTSFIVGFPGESEQAFERLVDFVRQQEFDHVGVFTYSREEGTTAYDLPAQVCEREKRRRRAQLMEVQAQISLRRNHSLLGKEIQVLVEDQIPGRATRMRGRTPWQAPEIDGMVMLRGAAEPGEFVHARVKQARTYDLVAEVVGSGQPERCKQ